MLSSKQLAELWHEHAAALVLLARPYGDAAEDAVQEAFLRLAVQEPVPHSPAAWLYRVVRNEAVSQTRSQRRRRDRESRVAGEQPQWLEGPAFTADLIADAEEVQRGLASLDDAARDIVVAHIWGSMTFRELGDAFGISRAKAHRLYQQGIQQLQLCLKKTCKG